MTDGCLAYFRWNTEDNLGDSVSQVSELMRQLVRERLSYSDATLPTRYVTLDFWGTQTR